MEFDGDDLLASSSGRFTRAERASGTYCNRRLGRPQKY